MLAHYPDLNGKSVFITGGGSGIGASLTEGLLRQGAKVAFANVRMQAPFVMRCRQPPAIDRCFCPAISQI